MSMNGYVKNAKRLFSRAVWYEKEDMLSWVDFSVWHRRKIAFWNFSMGLTITPILEQDEEVWQFMEPADSTEQSII